MTRYLALCVGVLCAAIVVAGGPRPLREADHFLAMDKELIALNTPEGRKLLGDSKAQEAFWQLVQFYSPQPDLGSCSVGSCTMVLNALPIERPVSKQHRPYKLYTADNFFTPEVEGILKTEKTTARQKVSGSGITLEQLAEVLASFPVTVKCVYGSASNIDTFRSVLGESLTRSDTYIVVNYLRKSLKQESGGHISPLGAYNEKADRVLVIDTANYKYPWTWVKMEDLWKAMAGTIDSESNRSRGYVIVAAKTKE